MIMVGIGAASPVLCAAQGNNTGAVFILTNDAKKNQVIAYERAANGTLSEPVYYDTNGRGSGGTTDPLESQGSLTLSQDHSLLFAVNAGSGTVSVFSVHKANLIHLLFKAQLLPSRKLSSLREITFEVGLDFLTRAWLIQERTCSGAHTAIDQSLIAHHPSEQTRGL
jgi:hypothetical protein